LSTETLQEKLANDGFEQNDGNREVRGEEKEVCGSAAEGMH